MDDEQADKVLSLVWSKMLTQPDRSFIEFLSEKVYADHRKTPSESQIEAFLKKACIQRQTEPKPQNTVDLDTMLDQSGVHSLTRDSSTKEIIEASEKFAKFAIVLDPINQIFAKDNLKKKLKAIGKYDAHRLAESFSKRQTTTELIHLSIRKENLPKGSRRLWR